MCPLVDPTTGGGGILGSADIMLRPPEIARIANRKSAPWHRLALGLRLAPAGSADATAFGPERLSTVLAQLRRAGVVGISLSGCEISVNVYLPEG